MLCKLLLQFFSYSHADKSSGTTANDKECLSSSEERIVRVPSFAEARRSKKYMSKRTSGTFRDYLRSRSNEPSLANGNNKQECRNHTAADADDDDDNSGQENGPRENETNYRNAKELLRLAHRNNSMRSSTYSSFINNMHGLKQASCTEDDGDFDRHESASEIAGDARSISENGGNRTGANGRVRRDTSRCSNNTYSDFNDNVDDDDDDDDDGDEEDDDVFNGNTTTSNSSFLKKYASEDGHMKTESQFEATDDWYASASDMDDSDSALSKTYGQNAINPVLECVNQVRNIVFYKPILVYNLYRWSTF